MLRRFCAPNIGGATQLDYASLVDLKTGEVVWFNVVQAGSQVPGIKFGDLRTPQGAEQMVERLLGRMKPALAVRERSRQRADVLPLLEISRRSLLVGGAAAAASLYTGVAQARVRPQDMVPLVGPASGRPKRTSRASGSSWNEPRRRSPDRTC